MRTDSRANYGISYSDNGLFPARGQGIICPNDLMSIGSFRTNINEIRIKTQQFDSGKLSLNVVYEMVVTFYRYVLTKMHRCGLVGGNHWWFLYGGQWAPGTEWKEARGRNRKHVPGSPPCLLHNLQNTSSSRHASDATDWDAYRILCCWYVRVQLLWESPGMSKYYLILFPVLVQCVS